MIIHNGKNDCIKDLENQLSGHQFNLCLENETVTEAVLRVNLTIGLAFRFGQFSVPSHAAGVSKKYMAETVTRAILMINLGFPRIIRGQRNRIWAPQDWDSLDQKTALIIGLGGIGSRVAERLKSYACECLVSVIHLNHVNTLISLFPCQR